ncbi:MAG: hypothetical protein ACKVU1_05210 [bacterium]
MERRSIEAIVRALTAANARYLIVGGLAVVAHGHLRFTADVDLVLDLDEANLLRATGAFATLGYRPRAPVDLREFCSAERRTEWARDKGMTVFSLNSDQHPATEIDVFVEAPFDFAAAYRVAARKEIAPGLMATFVGLDDLIGLKERAARPQDLEDVARLRERGAGA